MAKVRIVLLRHAPPVTQGICYGRFAIPVRKLFPAEKSNLQKLWKNFAPEVNLIHSPAERCLSLANFLWNTTPGCHLIKDDRLQELNFGTWEGRAWNEIPRCESDVWATAWETLCTPQGESFAQMVNRLRSFWKDLCCLNKNTWVVAHAGSLRILLAIAKNISPETMIDTAIPFLHPITLELKNNA